MWPFSGSVSIVKNLISKFDSLIMDLEKAVALCNKEHEELSEKIDEVFRYWQQAEKFLKNIKTLTGREGE